MRCVVGLAFVSAVAAAALGVALTFVVSTVAGSDVPATPTLIVKILFGTVLGAFVTASNLRRLIGRS